MRLRCVLFIRAATLSAPLLRARAPCAAGRALTMDDQMAYALAERVDWSTGGGPNPHCSCQDVAKTGQTSTKQKKQKDVSLECFLGC